MRTNDAEARATCPTCGNSLFDCGLSSQPLYCGACERHHPRPTYARSMAATDDVTGQAHEDLTVDMDAEARGHAPATDPSLPPDRPRPTYNGPKGPFSD